MLKQYDGDLCYCSPIYDEDVNTYAESLFMVHCTAVDLMAHFFEVVQPVGSKGVNLLHLGMDCPRVKNCRLCFMRNRTNQYCF